METIMLCRLILLFLTLRISACETVAPLSAQSRQIAVDMHNKFRSIVAQGGAKNRGVSPLPTAVKMRKVTYSMGLEEKASVRASACDISFHTAGQNYVENYAIYSVKIANVTQEKAMEEGVAKWFSELLNVGVNGIVFTKSTAFGVRHFTQMVWENLSEIGCAVNFCGDIHGSALNGLFKTRALVVCMYQPKGNRYSTPIYEAGPTCSKCNELNAHCEADTQLCTV